MVRKLTAALASLFLSMAAPVQAQVCKCVDIGDIKARILEASTAISAYSAEMQKMGEQMLRTQEAIPYSPARREKLQGRVKDALTQVSSGGRISATPTLGHTLGGTGNLCQTEINLHPSATACMRESVKRHEDHHSSECKKTLAAGSILTTVTTGKDRFERNNAQLMEYAMEEISGYTTEIAFLQGELARLERSEECKPKPKPERRAFTAQQRNR